MPEMNDEEARASLDASEKLYYRIGEVSKLTGVKAHVLRYWETEFRWMAPPKSRSKQRLYRKRDIEFVWLLKRFLWDERYTIAGARQRIQDLGVDDALALLRQNDQRKGVGNGATSSAAQMDAASEPDSSTLSGTANSRGKARSAGKQSKRKTKAATNVQGGSVLHGDSSNSSVGSDVSDVSDRDALPEARRAEWLAFGAALGDLHSELSTIRGALQEGL